MTRSGPETKEQSRHAGELHLLFHTGGHLLAIPTTGIERMLLASEARHARAASGDVVVLDDIVWPHANLGEMLGVEATRDACVLLHVPHVLGAVRVALSTGPCLVVRPIVRLAALPTALFRTRPGAIAGVFHAAQAGLQSASGGGPPVGLIIDPMRLFSENEIARFRACILSALEPNEGAS